jgi:hypothetical protein
MSIVKTGLRCTIAAALLCAGPGGWASLPFRQAPTPGVRHYRYTVVQTINANIVRGYRVDFDLESGRDGSIDAILLSSEALDGAHWTATAIDPTCRTAMHGTATSLARARLWPIGADIAASLGNGFLDTCAPPGIFFPLTDIINAVIVPLAQNFRASALRRQGQSVRYPGFTAAFDRAGEGLHEVSDGGEVRLTRLERDQAVIDWLPDIARLEIVERSGPTPVTLHGTEHWAFRIVLDRHSGVILDAHTLYDDLDLTVADMPGAPPARIARTVRIAPR